MKKIPVGVLGATGMVGQRYIYLLANHPYFEVVYTAASSRSAGKTYEQAVEGRWLIGSDIPEGVKKLIVRDASDVSAAKGKCRFVFSALEMDKDAIKKLEEEYASSDIPVVSNASANRWTEDVPMLIPEINPEHTDIIAAQKKRHGWNKGFIAVKPNCSLQSYMAPIFALIKAGYPVKRMIVTTLQAVSGAGYPGVPSFDMIDNIVPYIGGEEEKTEKECLKILGTVRNGKIENAAAPLVAAHCNRVPVIDGHTACVSLEFDLPQKRQAFARTHRKRMDFFPLRAAGTEASFRPGSADPRTARNEQTPAGPRPRHRQGHGGYRRQAARMPCFRHPLCRPQPQHETRGGPRRHIERGITVRKRLF